MIYLNFIITRNVKSYIYVGRELYSSYVVKCEPQVGDYLIIEYPNKFFLTFVSTATDNTAYYQLDVQYNKFKQWQYQNDIRCAGVSNVKPDDGGDNNTPNNTNNDTNDGVMYGGHF